MFAAVVALFRGSACTSGGETQGGLAGAAAGGSTTGTSSSTSTTTSSSTTSSATGGSGGAPAPKPCPNWPGWETWDDYAPSCPFCVPASVEALPPPIAWEPCDLASGFTTGCRQMRVDWPYITTPFGYGASIDTTAPNTVMMQIGRVSRGDQPWLMTVVAEADGPVHSAFLDPRGLPSKPVVGCHVVWNWASQAQGRHVFGIQGDFPEQYDGSDFPEAAVGGSIDELHPAVLKPWSHLAISHRYAAADTVWASDGAEGIGAARWGEPWPVVTPVSEPGWGMSKYLLGARGDFVWSAAQSGIYDGIMAWTPSRGSYPFLLYPGEKDHGAESLGTDRTDMVWIDERDKGPVIGPYAERSVMASPFTDDPAALVPRRLRSFPTAKSPTVPFAVGCGHAAVRMDTEVLVVRLSDGWAWILSPPTPATGWGLREAFAVSCEEVFVLVNLGQAANIARIRLDALGPGLAPD